MRRLVILIVACISCVGIAFAYNPEEEKVCGPVKKITETIRIENDNVSLYYGDQTGQAGVRVQWFDSIGRLVEYSDHPGDNIIVYGSVRQYTDSICVEYAYNEKGLIKGSFAIIRLDSAGHHILDKRYQNRKLINIDSLVYNVQGQIVEWYQTRHKSDSLDLRYSYEYDSLGRLCKVNDPFYRTGHEYVIEYLPNGNYVEHHSDKNGKKWERTFFVDKLGRVIKEESSGKRVQYLHFDQYGNWTKMKSSVNTKSPMGWVTSITERKFEYYE